MQTVTNNYTMNIDFSGATITLNAPNAVSFNSGGSIQTQILNGDALSGLVGEAVRIFSGLDIKGQAKALVYLCELEASGLRVGSGADVGPTRDEVSA